MYHYLALSALLLVGNVNSITYGDNTICPSLSKYAYPKITPFGQTYRLVFSEPVLMQKLLINTHGCDGERQLIEGAFSVAFIDGSDATYELKMHDEYLSGSWDRDEYIIEVPLGGVLYAEELEVNSTTPIECSTVYAHGCTTDEICRPDTCKNGGTCIGNKKCACVKGFMGDDCSASVADMSFDNYDIVAAAPGLLFTTDAPFEVTGDVSFTIDGRNVKRTYGHHHSSYHHGNSAHFHGHGGSCHYSHSHSAGYSHGHHSTYGHHSSHNSYSSMNGAHSYSHSCQHSHGHNHDHHSHHYLYTTHGCNHHTHGASLHYHNHQLHLHVHDHHHHHHYHCSAHYNPQPGVVNNIVSSFSQTHGACIMVNGHIVSQQIKPTVAPPTTQPPTTQAPVQPGLCFGLCGTPNMNNLLLNSTLSNMLVAGASVPTLTQNNLLGMLGNNMVNFLLNQLLPMAYQRQTTTKTTTKKPPTTTLKTANIVVTQAPALTLPAFTKAPTTTLPPVTATSTAQPVVTSTNTALPKVTATSPTNHGPICHDCLRLDHNGNCSNAMQCSLGDVCLAMHDRYGYTHRCISKPDCDHGVLKATADCWYCCSTNLCNDKCNGGNTSGCQDDPQCASLRNLGAFYDVCSDPALSTTTCKKTCNKCP